MAWLFIQEQGLLGVNSMLGNSFYLQFDIGINCDFIFGICIFYCMWVEQICKDFINMVVKVIGCYQIEGVELFYVFNLNVNFLGSFNCGDMLVLNVIFQYFVNMDVNLYVILLVGMAYVLGFIVGNIDYLEFVLQDGQFKWIINSFLLDVMLVFSIVVEEGIECVVFVLSYFIIIKVFVICVSEGQFCEIEVVIGDVNLLFLVDKVAYEIIDIFVMVFFSLFNDLQLEAIIINIVDFNGLFFQVAFYFDFDGDGVLSLLDLFL